MFSFHVRQLLLLIKQLVFHVDQKKIGGTGGGDRHLGGTVRTEHQTGVESQGLKGHHRVLHTPRFKTPVRLINPRGHMIGPYLRAVEAAVVVLLGCEPSNDAVCVAQVFSGRISTECGQNHVGADLY